MIDYSIRFFGLLKSLLICKFVILQNIARINLTGVFWSLNVPNCLFSVKNRDIREICFPQKHNKSYQNNFQFGLMTKQIFPTVFYLCCSNFKWRWMIYKHPLPPLIKNRILVWQNFTFQHIFSKLMTRDWFLDPVIFCVFWEGLKRSIASPNLIWIDED